MLSVSLRIDSESTRNISKLNMRSHRNPTHNKGNINIVIRYSIIHIKQQKRQKQYKATDPSVTLEATAPTNFENCVYRKSNHAV